MHRGERERERNKKEREKERERERENQKKRKESRETTYAKGKKIIRCKWVYKRKPDRYKARLVVKGFMQSPFDYGETYAPVCKLSTIRTMLSLLPSKKNWGARQIDIGNAFIEAYLPPGEEVYMDNIPGYERHGYAVKLVRVLYGLK